MTIDINNCLELNIKDQRFDMFQQVLRKLAAQTIVRNFLYTSLDKKAHYVNDKRQQLF